MAGPLAALAEEIKSDSAPLIRTAGSGPWSEKSTWENGRLPEAGCRVLIRPGHRVVYDAKSDTPIRVLKIAGTLQFATDRDTQLEVGLVRIEHGEGVGEEGFDCDAHVSHQPSGPTPTLQVGSPEKPVEARHTALIRLRYFEGMDKNSCPAMICCGGRMDFHGAPLNRTWVKFGAAPKDGEPEITLDQDVAGWRPGHKVLIVSTARLFLFGGPGNQLIPSVRERSQSEVRTVLAVQGNKLLLDKPLQHEHRAEGDYRGEIANLSRNVIVESAEPNGVRGHTMYHTTSSGSISYAEFRHLGKRDVLGRYSLHFHLCRDTMRGSSVIGASIHDSHNRWITVHGTDYLLIRDCVGYHSIGHGFFMEDGTEVFNVWDHNLAVQALRGKPLPKQVLPYDENEGAGFWWANSRNTFTRNVAAECDQYAYRFEATKTPDFDPVLSVPQPNGKLEKTDIRTLPFVRFDDNEAHTMRRFTLNLGGLRHVSDEEDLKQTRAKEGGDLSRIQGGTVDGIGPDYQHPFIIRNFRVWQSHWVFHGGSPNVLIDGLDAVDCTYGIFKTKMDGHEYKNMSMQRIDTAMIFHPVASTNFTENWRRYIDDKHDDLPPTTVITHVDRVPEGKLRVRGHTADNGRLKCVTVNGQEATILRDGYFDWQIELASDSAAGIPELVAQAEDAAGNLELCPHRKPLVPGHTQALPPHAK